MSSTITKVAFITFWIQVFKMQHVFTIHFNMNEVHGHDLTKNTGHQSPCVRNYTCSILAE